MPRGQIYCSIRCRGRRQRQSAETPSPSGPPSGSRAPYRRTAWASANLLYAEPSRQRNANDRWKGVFDAVTRLSTRRSSTFVWRGHASVEWPLQAAIHRKLRLRPPTSVDDIALMRSETLALLDRARRHRHDNIPGWPAIPDLPLLALLQHHGAATPLVDVTTDPTVGLYFAAQPLDPLSEEEGDGVLLAIDVRPQGGRYFARAAHFEVGDDATWERAIDRLHVEELSVGLYTPPMVTSRILAQRGRFIFGEAATNLPYSTVPVVDQLSWTDESLDNLFGDRQGRVAIPSIVGIVVPAHYKKTIRQVLAATYGLTAETLFPDLGGFAAAHGPGADPLQMQ